MKRSCINEFPVALSPHGFGYEPWKEDCSWQHLGLQRFLCLRQLHSRSTIHQGYRHGSQNPWSLQLQDACYCVHLLSLSCPDVVAHRVFGHSLARGSICYRLVGFCIQIHQVFVQPSWIHYHHFPDTPHRSCCPALSHKLHELSEMWQLGPKETPPGARASFVLGALTVTESGVYCRAKPVVASPRWEWPSRICSANKPLQLHLISFD